MMPASAEPLRAPAPRWPALAGIALLAAWLGGTLPVLWLQTARTEASAAGDWTAAQLLAQIPPAMLTASRQHPVLLRQAGHCPCTIGTVPAPGGITRDTALALPFDWLVLHDQRLIYAGPALLGPGCSRSPLTAVALVGQLLRRPQAPLILSTPCPCKE
ncbi:hypothetical protein [Stenotrophomonas sp. NPDC077659]|uniref:hypothetical protein n=1 Tax=Stenotrophomonas sp. NPDC077659 TaxID=3390694 RepID=UPI003D01557D